MRPLSSSTAAKGIVAVVGVGPRLGSSIAHKFAHEGYTVATLARDLGRLSRFADEIAREEKAQAFAIRIDCSDARSLREAFEGVHSLGFVEVLVYNACPTSSWHAPRFADIRLESFQKALAVSSTGASHCAQQVIPDMVDRGKGTILFTGSTASLNGIAGFCELTLSQCLAKEFQPQGIHVAHVVIDGIVGVPRSLQRSSPGEQSSADISMDPDAIALTCWHLHVQDECMDPGYRPPLLQSVILASIFLWVLLLFLL